MSLLARRVLFAAADAAGGGGGGGDTDYENAVLADSPLAFFLLDETSGSTAADSSGNSRDATIVGTPDYGQTGPAGIPDAIGLNSPSGTDEWITVPDLSALSCVGFEVWFKDDAALTPSMTLQRLLRAGADDDNIFFGPVSGSVNNEIITTFRKDGGSAFSGRAYADPNGSIPTDWHHLLVQWTGSRWEVWLDGADMGNVDWAFSGLAQGNFSWDTINLGNSSASTGSPFRGLLAAAAFYPSVLPMARVMQHYIEGTAGTDVGTWADEITADAPVMWLRLGESSGTTATDEQGNHDGTYSGVALGVAGLTNDSDTAAEWDTVSDYVQVADHADFDANSFTFECWLKHDDPTSDAISVVADKTGLGNNGSWGIWYENRSSQGSPRALKFYLRGAVVQWAGAATEAALAAGGHLLCIKNGTQGLMFWNGRLVATGTLFDNNGTALPLRIGQQANGTSFGWDGIIDEVAFYTTALAPTKAARHYLAGS